MAACFITISIITVIVIGVVPLCNFIAIEKFNPCSSFQETEIECDCLAIKTNQIKFHQKDKSSPHIQNCCLMRSSLCSAMLRP